MQVTVEATGELERRLTITLPGDDFEKKVQERLRSMVSRVKIDGFRPGKVPYKVVERRYGSAVRQEVQDEFVENSFRDAIKQESLRIAGPPRIEPRQAETGKPFEYIATFEVLPVIEIVNLKEIKVKRPSVEVTDADVDALLEKLRRQHRKWEPVERPAQEGDGVTITYHGTIGGESFPGGKREDFFVILGEKMVLKDFEEQLKGAKQGQELAFEVTFPEDYGEELAGKQARFVAQVKSVSAPKLPEIDEAFAEDLGIKEGGVAALRQNTRAIMTRDMERAIQDRLKEQVMESLLAANPIRLPQFLVEKEAETLLKQARTVLAGKGAKVEDIALDKAPFIEQARRQVALSLIMGAILDQQKIKADTEKLTQKVMELASSYEDPEEFVRWVCSDRERLSGIEMTVLENEAISWVLDQIEVTEEPMSFGDLVNPSSSSAETESSK